MAQQSFTIQKLPDRGNSVIASRSILSGECIVKNELPFVWSRVNLPNHQYHAFCEHCGVVLRRELFETLLSTLTHGSTIQRQQPAEVLECMKALLSVGDVTNIQCECHRSCGSIYCSSQCQELDKANGHDSICRSLQTLSDSSVELSIMDERGHFGSAAKVYARIATQTMENYRVDNTIDIAQNALQVANTLLADFHYEDFALTMHAFRTGRLEVDQTMFENIIFPAYFNAHLATPLALCKNIFFQSGCVLWSSLDAGIMPGEVTDLGRQRAMTFLSSEIFSDKYFSRILGTFAVNSLSVHVSSPLDHILSEAQRIANDQHIQQSQGHASFPPQPPSEEYEIGSKNPVLIREVITFLQELQRKQYEEENNYEEGEEDGDIDDVDEHKRCTSRGNNGRFRGMAASGLFSIFSKTNHSCLCNTSIHGSDRVSVTIKATEAIASGDEITNCYIHHHSLNNTSSSSAMADKESQSMSSVELTNPLHRLNYRLTKKQRYRALRQYVFECNCPLCNQQEIDSDEETD